MGSDALILSQIYLYSSYFDKIEHLGYLISIYGFLMKEGKKIDGFVFATTYCIKINSLKKWHAKYFVIWTKVILPTKMVEWVGQSAWDWPVH
jgi:hypothetical protein